MRNKTANLLPAHVPQRKSKLDRKEKLVALLYILVPVIGFCVFTLGTMVFTFIYSFQNYNPLRDTSTWVGFDNYEQLFNSRLFADSFRNSIFNTLFFLIGIPLNMALGLMLAAILKLGKIKGAKIYQGLFYLPAVSSAVAMNIVWRYIFNNEFGIINLIFSGIAGKQIKIAWISDDWLIKVAILIKNAVNGMGGSMIMYLAAMLNVPQDYYEAAELDGANAWRKFWSITFPLITPITFYLLITGLIGALQSYADAQVFGVGVRGAQTVVFFIWQRGIGQSRYGLAASASILLATVIMAVTVVQFRFSNKWVFED